MGAGIRKQDARQKNKGGFTQIEQIVISVIVLILASGLVFGIMKWVEWSNFKRQNEYAKTLFVAAQNQLTEYSEHGQLPEFQELITEGSGGYQGVDITTLKDENGNPYELESVWPQSQGKGNSSVYQETVSYIIVTGDDYKEYIGKTADGKTQAIYDMLSTYLYDTSILNGTICIEFTPENGQVFSVLYSDIAEGFEYNETNTNNRGVVNITNRETSYRKERMAGYYGVDTLSKATSTKAERPSINAVRLNNEDTLNLSFRLSKVQSALKELTYEITVCDRVTKNPLFTLRLNGKDLNSEAFKYASPASCDVTRYVYDEDNKLKQTQKLGAYDILAWHDKDGMVRVVLDAADLQATSALYYDAYKDLTKEGEDLSSDMSPDVKELKKTYSFRRFGVESDDIYCTISGTGKYYKATAKKQSNTEHTYFASEQLTELNNKTKATYTIKNARHLYNVRYMEDYSDAERNVQGYEALKTADEVVYQLAEHIDWKEFQKKESLFKGGGESLVDQDFPSVKQLRSDAEFVGIGNNSYAISALEITETSNEEAELYDEKDTKATGLFVMNEGRMSNFVLDKIAVTGTDNVGAFSGLDNGTMERLTVANSDVKNQPSTITGKNHVGGIVGGRGKVQAEEEIKYSKLTNRAKVQGEQYIGGIIGELANQGGTQKATIEECKNYGQVGAVEQVSPTDARYIGGIVGRIEGGASATAIQGCVSSPQYSGAEINTILSGGEALNKKLAGVYVGGIAGYSKNTAIRNCNTRKESQSKEGYVFGHSYVGGIVGYQATGETLDGTDTIGRAGINEAHIIGDTYVGGIAGCNATVLKPEAGIPVPETTAANTAVADWENRGAIAARSNYVGGITGYNTGSLKNCANNTDNASVADRIADCRDLRGNYAGGIAGYNNGTITADDTIFIVSRISGGNYLGGIVGYNDSNARIDNDYAVAGGYIRGRRDTGCYVGGYAGLNVSENLIMDGRLNSNPNEVTGAYCVGGTIGGNIVPMSADRESVFRTNNFLGELNAKAFAGGYIGFNKLVSASAADIKASAADSAARLAEAQSLKAAVDVQDNFGLASSTRRLTLTGDGNSGTQSRLGGITAGIYVGGVIGYNDANTRLLIKDVTNNTLVRATDAIENPREQNRQTYEGKPFLYSYAGGIIGKVSKNVTLDNCRNQDVGDVVTAGTYLGGLCEINEGTIQNCNVSSMGNGNADYVGGIAGLNKSGRIVDCKMQYRTITGRNYVGGIAAENFAVIETPILQNASITARGTVGGIAGHSGEGAEIVLESTIQDRYFVKISASGADIGGMVGRNAGAISAEQDFYTRIYMEGVVNGGQNVGGVIGKNEGGLVQDFVNECNVTAINGTTGGIVGTDTANESIIEDCASSGNITATKGGNAGGIIGNNRGEVIGCEAYGDVIAPNGISGGIAGENRGTLMYCAAGIKGQSPIYRGKLYAGGIAGVNNGRIEMCDVASAPESPSCTVTNQPNTRGSAIGGIAGQNTGTIKDCNVGNEVFDIRLRIISNASDAAIGGIAGMNFGTITSETYDKNKVCAELSFTQTQQSYYGNMGGIAGANTGKIQQCEYVGSIRGTGNNPQLSPEYNPNTDYETNGAVIYGYGGIAGVNGNSGGKSTGEISNCHVKMSRITGIGDPNNIANIGGVAGVNGLGAQISNVTFGSESLYKVEQTANSKYEVVKNVQASVYVGTENSTSASAHSGGVAGLNSGSISGIGYDEKKGTYNPAVDGMRLIVENSSGHAGGIAGYNRRTGIVRNVSTGKNWVVFAPGNLQDNGCGGVVGYQASEQGLVNCVNRATVEKTVQGSNGVGGMIGRLECATSGSFSIRDCQNYGNIYGNGRVGGMVGVWKYYGGTIADCINYGTIETKSGEGAGGIVGRLYDVGTTAASIVRCENHGTILGSPAGGVLGTSSVNAYIQIRKCVNTGLIQSGADNAGITGKLNNVKADSFIADSNNYGYGVNSNVLSGIVPGGTIANLKVMQCFGIADTNYPITSGGTVNKDNYYISNDGTTKGKGTLTKVEKLSNGAYQLKRVSGASDIVGLPGFPKNPVQEFADGSKAQFDTALKAMGNQTDNIRYQVFKADNPYFVHNAPSVTTLETPVITAIGDAGSGVYKAEWKSVPNASYYGYTATYKSADGAVIQRIEDIVYDSSVLLSISDINGVPVKTIEFKVRAGTDTVVNGSVKQIWSSYANNTVTILPVLPVPQYHMELIRDGQTLQYRAYLDNQEEYIAFLKLNNTDMTEAALLEALGKIKIVINDFNSGSNQNTPTVAEPVSDWFYSGESGNKNNMFSAFASDASGKYTSSSKILRESQAPGHGVYTGTGAMAAPTLIPNKTGQIGFSGNTANTLSYQIKIGFTNYVAYMRSELLVTDKSLGVPVAVSTSQVRLSDTASDKTVRTALSALPVNLLDEAVYGDDLMIRSYPAMMSNNVIYTGHIVDVSQVKQDTGSIGLSAEELKTLYVTDNNQVTDVGIAGQDTPLIDQKNGTSSLADGFVIELAPDGTYTLYFNSLLEYNAGHAYETTIGTQADKTQVFYYQLEESKKTQYAPVVHVNYDEQTHADGNPDLDDMEITWDLAKQGYENEDGAYNYEDGAVYDYIITGYTADGTEAQIDAGQYTTSQDKQNILTYDTTLWNYGKVNISISRHGTMNDKEMTELFPSGTSEICKLKLKFSQIGKPDVTLHKNEAGVVQKNSLVYDVSWENIPEEERNPQTGASELSDYEVTVERGQDDTVATTAYADEAEFNAALAKAESLYSGKPNVVTTEEDGKKIYTWQEQDAQGRYTVKKIMVLEQIAKTADKPWSISKTLTGVWTFAATDNDRTSDNVTRMLDLNDYERGETIAISVRALTSDSAAVYRDGMQGVERELLLPSRLDVPDVTEMKSNPSYHAASDTELGEDAKTYMTLEEFEQGIKLLFKPSEESGVLQGKYQIAAAVYEQRGDESDVTKIAASGDGEEASQGYWNSGAVKTLYTKASETAMDGTLTEAERTVEGLDASDAGQWLKIAMRSISDSNISSEWSDEDDTASGTINYRWIQIPRIQVGTPNVEKSTDTKTLYYRNGVWLGDPAQSAPPTVDDVGVEQTALTIDMEDNADQYQIQLIRSQRTDQIRDVEKTYTVQYLDWIYLEKTGEDNYNVFYASSDPGFDEDAYRQQNPNAPTTSMDANAVWVGSVQGINGFIQIPYFGNAAEGAGENAPTVTTACYLQQNQAADGGRQFFLVLPDAESIAGYVNSEYLFTSQISAQARIAKNHLDKYEDSKISNWYRTTGTDGSVVTLDAYNNAPSVGIKCVASTREDIAYELQAETNKTRLVYEVKVEDGSGIWRREYISAYASGISTLDTVALLLEADYSNLAGKSISVRVAAIMDGNNSDGQIPRGLTKWSDWVEIGSLPAPVTKNAKEIPAAQDVPSLDAAEDDNSQSNTTEDGTTEDVTTEGSSEDNTAEPGDVTDSAEQKENSTDAQRQPSEGKRDTGNER